MERATGPLAIDSAVVRRRVNELRRRRQKRARSRKGGFQVDLAPMIDMSFTMLIFFVATTRFDRPEGVLTSKLPPKVDRPSLPALPITPIVVRLSNTAGVDLGCKIQVDSLKSQPKSFAELADFLRDLQARPGFDTQTPVILLSEDDVAWDAVVNAWNAAVRGGCRNLIFGQSGS